MTDQKYFELIDSVPAWVWKLIGLGSFIASAWLTIFCGIMLFS